MMQGETTNSTNNTVRDHYVLDRKLLIREKKMQKIELARKRQGLQASDSKDGCVQADVAHIFDNSDDGISEQANACAVFGARRGATARRTARVPVGRSWRQSEMCFHGGR